MCSYQSPHDPIFYAHHGFVDRLWWTWQKNSGKFKEGPTGPLEHTLCPADGDKNDASDWLDSRKLPGVHGNVKVCYKTRERMEKEGTSESKLQSAAYWQMRIGEIPGCCHEGLAKIGIKTAKAKIRLTPGGQDLCAVNCNNTEFFALKAWCELGDGNHNTGEKPCHCDDIAQKIVDKKEQEDLFSVLHCEVEHPEPDERRLCMALYPTATCADNMFDKCVEHKIMWDAGDEDDEDGALRQGMCIPEYAEQLVRNFQRAKHSGRKIGPLLQESTIEALMQEM